MVQNATRHYGIKRLHLVLVSHFTTIYAATFNGFCEFVGRRIRKQKQNQAHFVIVAVFNKKCFIGMMAMKIIS